jgi:SAM-dependent methyltransferase
MLSVKFWNTQAFHKKRSTTFTATYFNASCKSAISKITHLIALNENSKVLKTDLWNESVAPEREVLKYFSKQATVYGMDLGAIQCGKAHKRLVNLSAAQGDIRNIPFANKTFDAILDVSTIDHVTEPEAQQVIAEYSRLLCDGGVLLLIYAQNQPFASQYWNRQFEGMYLLNPKTINKSLNETFEVIEDRPLDLLHSVFGLPPFRFLEKLVGHCPSKMRGYFLAALLNFELSTHCTRIKGFAGLRLNIAVKRSLV